MTATQIVVTWFRPLLVRPSGGRLADGADAVAPVTEPTQPVPLHPTQPTLPAPTADPAVAPPDDYWSQTAFRRLGELSAEARAGLVTEDEAYYKLRDIHGDAASSENPTVANAIAEVLRLHTIGAVTLPPSAASWARPAPASSTHRQPPPRKRARPCC
jgi:hypothetical protein